MSVEKVAIEDLMNRSGVGFGTSGARGRVVDMTPAVCYAYTRGFLQHVAWVERQRNPGIAPLTSGDGAESGKAVAIAGDLRPSTPEIMKCNCRRLRRCWLSTDQLRFHTLACRRHLRNAARHSLDHGHR